MSTETSVEDVLAHRLHALRHKYTSQLPVKIAEINRNWEAVRHSRRDAEALDTLYRLAHDLAGSGATFGFPQISQAAQCVERFLHPGLYNGALEPNVSETRMVNLVLALESASTESAAPSEAMDLSGQKFETAEVKHVFILDDDTDRAKALEAEVTQYGYQVRVFRDPEAFANRSDSGAAAAVVMNIEYLDGTPRGTAVLRDCQKIPSSHPAVIFIAPRESHESRIAAVRAGGRGFLIRPFNTGKLIQIINEVADELLEPYRVLAVEDDPDQAAQYAAVLEGAGMRTLVTCDPRTLFDDLVEFDAEMILMDLYLPGCNGLELAAALRQRESATGIPIVFLSTEVRIDRQLEALRQGGDDFLTKPITPAHLAATVASRVKRARIVRSYMVRDSLTDALNHAAFMDQFEREVSRAKRTETPLAFALLDLDRFKSVNDLHGHGAGDRVIKAISRLLHQRLRRTDIIGRYGGEEFAIVFTGTNATAAESIANAMRIEFSEQVFTQDGQEFSVTFSGGIAELSPAATAHELRDAADRAMYVAKDAGRDRISIAPRL